MDDPWANAWGEPTKPDAGSAPTWVSSTTNNAQDSEADIAMPSWATGAGVKWAEPSNAQDSLWDASMPLKEWAASPYDSIYLGKGSVDELPQPSDYSSPEPIGLSPPVPSPPASPSPTAEIGPPEDDAATSRPSSPTVSSFGTVSQPGSPDAFGTFETGLDSGESDADPWSHSEPVSDPTSFQAPAWGGAGWGATSSTMDVSLDNKPVDEWEKAKQLKERQDRHVPPQVLASVLHQFEELSLELWPKAMEASDQDVDNRSQNGQHGVEKIDGITSVIDKLIPQNLTLPPYVHFPKTFTSKHMGESLRFTRHVATTRSSPMAIYLASKGSTAWETSVKSRPEVLKDDLLPPGWRVIEKEKDATIPAADVKKKASGGLLSFFGRRGGPTSPLAASPSRSTSPVRPPSGTSVVPPSSASVGSTRASVDSSSSQTRSTTPVTSSPIRLSTTSLESTPNGPALSSAPSILSSSPQQNIPDPTPSTSAVSRFLTRFSRGKQTGSSPRNSLALSTDDLEFLSDIVPSANDDVDEASQLRELSNMIGSSPLPTKLPPPLPPPPRLLPTRDSSNKSTSNYQNTIRPPEIYGDFLIPSMFDSPVTNPPADPEPQASPLPKPFTNSLLASSLSLTTPIVEATFPLSMNQYSSPFDSPSAPTPASKTRAPFHQKRIPIAIMSTAVAPTPSRDTSFSFLPPPPASRILPPIPPPSLNTGATTPSQKAQESSSKVLTILESTRNDDFSEFRSTPVIATTSFDSSISSVFSDKSLITSSSASTSGTKDLFDDFDDFVSSPLRTPSPPYPPAKPVLFGHKPLQQPLPFRSTSPTKPQPPPPRRASRAADHQRTMSLLDIAATRQGRWPAPPSPLPRALPPPPGNSSSSGFDILNEGSTAASLGPSISSPAVFPDSETTPQLSNFSPPAGFVASLSPQLRAISPPITTQQNEGVEPTLSNTRPEATRPGGLSAQDLSFFEGI